MSHEDFPTENPAVVTCGLPYANGDLHIGHLRGYVAADAFTRGLRKLGQDAIYVCGSDMHGTPIAVNADEEGVSPEEFALRHHEQYEETFPEFNVDFDNYGHTHDETNTALTKEFVRSWIDDGLVYEKEIQVAYDPEADQWLPDRYVEGTCPYCGAHARGDECDEGCQRHLEPGEIEDPVNSQTGNPAEYRTREHKFFELSEFQEYLQGFINRLEGTKNAQNQPREWIEGDLQDLCITRDMDWGVDYPGEEGDRDGRQDASGEAASSESDLVLYVWVDAPIEYVSSTKQYSERVGADEYDWEEVWKDGDSEIIHVIGRDIIQHHTVYWPAMLRGAGYNEPRAVCATGFVNLNGKGLSTSKNRAIWAQEYLDEGFHPDLFRYYIATASGFERDVNFSWDRFQERVNSELADVVGNFAYRALLFAARNYDGTPDVPLSDDVETEIASAMDDYEDALNDYDLRSAGEIAVALARYGNEYIQNAEPWKLDDEEAAPVIRDCVQLAKAVAVLLQPFTPEKADELWSQLGEDGSAADATVADCLQEPPAEFGEPEALFEKIEDDRVAELNEKLESRVEAETAEDAEAEDAEAEGASEFEPLTEDRISFDDFQDLDLRVGRITAAAGVEGADELVRLDVDIGVETRQIVAGLKELHDVDDLEGKKVVVVANLEKAELFGVESNGMVLAAGEQADLLTTHGDADPGTRVR